jgi:hypothetical protein
LPPKKRRALPQLNLLGKRTNVGALLFFNAPKKKRANAKKKNDSARKKKPFV